MREIDINNWERYRNFEFFKNFSNTTYGMNVRMDVTKLVKHAKENNESFFIDLLYIVLKGLNSVDEMKMRLVNDKPVIYDDINPAFTVMTRTGTYENVRFKNSHDFKDFYEIAHKYIEAAKEQVSIKKDDYNPKDCYDEYYITCAPWVDYTHISHPIPDDKGSQSIPRICWGKYSCNDNRYALTLNITVSHMFVDGYPLSMTFNTIQDLLDDVQNILK